MQKIIKFFNNTEFRLYVLLLLLATLGYGLLIPQLGLYGDDPAFLSIFHFSGPGGYQNYLGWFRPFAPWIYVLITPLFGEHIWVYHVFLLVLRWVSAILFYQLLKMIWPERTHQLAWAACLFILYPGFRQPAMPLEFSLHFATLSLYLISCLLMIGSIQKPRYYVLYTLGALITGLGLFGIEYFTGLEFLRPFMIAIIILRLNNKGKDWLKKTFVYELPYLALLMAYLVWRLFFLKTGYYQPTIVSDLATKPLSVMLQLFTKAFKDLLTSGVLAWTDIYRFPGSGSSLYIYLGLFIVVALSVFFYFKNESLHSVSTNEKWGWTGLASGVVMMVTGGIPLWSVGLPVELVYPWDRSSAPYRSG